MLKSEELVSSLTGPQEIDSLMIGCIPYLMINPAVSHVFQDVLDAFQKHRDIFKLQPATVFVEIKGDVGELRRVKGQYVVYVSISKQLFFA